VHPLPMVLLSVAVGLQGGVTDTGPDDASAVPTASRKEILPRGAMARMGPMRTLNFGRVMAVAFTPDGRQLAAGCWEGTVWLGDVAGAKIVRQWQTQGGMIRAVAFAPDAKVLASASTTGEIGLWNAKDGRLLKSLKAGDRVWHVGFSPDGKYLAAGCEKSIRLWDWADGTLRYAIDVPANGGGLGTSAPVFSTDGSTLAYLLNQNTLHVVDVAAGKVRQSSSVLDWSWQRLSPSGTYLARFEARGGQIWPSYFLEVWDLAAKRQRFQTINPNPVLFECLAFAHDERSLALSGGRNKITVIELATGQIRKEFTSADKGEVCLSWSADGKVLATGSVDQSVLLWDVTGRMPKGQWQSLKVTEKDLAELWNDLAVVDGPRSYAAMWHLVAGAEHSVSFLLKKLEPRGVDSKQLTLLMLDLNADSFQVRDRAFKELEKFQMSAEPFLRKRLEEKSSLESSRRLEELLSRMESQWLRLSRALEVLESIGNPAAREGLRRLAQGASASRLTQEAQKTIRRQLIPFASP
jgi:WD40 repeat protein